jgi:hypothetical protein
MVAWTHPNRIPPKATNPLIRMAGHALPSVPGGFSKRTPIVDAKWGMADGVNEGGFRNLL